ncbi:MAG: arginine deiminase-related protein [Flavobacteriales bacterium]|jgi:hypothetical protein|nr:arginine deiminase-related protein [Flavobacteriales bacterium]
MTQSTQHVVMIRPDSFRMNEETAENNHYQQALTGITPEEIRDRALEEFEGLVDLLERHGVHVLIWDEMPDSDTPDCLFPNNWFSTHAHGLIIHYPMYAENRRQERREDIAVDLEHLHGFDIKEILDFTEFEEHNKFLEGTGSMVLDRAHGKSYAALSERTDRGALAHYCSALDVEGVAFEAFQTVNGTRLPIYHTNVMMSIGSGFAAICLDCIDDDEERTMVLETLENDNLEVIALTEEQIGSFAGNMLELQGDKGKIIVMSSAAYNVLTSAQKEQLSHHGTIVHTDLTTIETCGGGSARCMIAENHLPHLASTT